MPAKSEKQRRFLHGVASGSIKRKGITKADARRALGKHGKKK